jgi:hypothetical protein
MLYEHLENYAVAIREWYLRDKRSKRRYSRLLRGLAILFASVGGLAPLIILGHQNLGARWGYVFLGSAAACIAFDRLFGLSAAWMRDIAGAQAADRTLSELYCEWASIQTTENQAGSRIDRQIALLKHISQTLGDILGSETSAWRLEFESSLNEIRSIANRTGDTGSSNVSKQTGDN